MGQVSTPQFAAPVLPADKAIPSMNASKILLKPGELHPGAQKLGSKGANLERILRAEVTGTASWVVFRTWSYMRAQTSFSAANGGTAALLLVTLIFVLVIAFSFFAAKQMCSVPVDGSRIGDRVSAPRGTKSLLLPVPSASRLPETSAGTDPLGAMRGSIDPMKRFVLSTKSNAPYSTAGSIVASTVPTTQASALCPTGVLALCPGLVVPDACECMLLLPRLKRGHGTGKAMVCDVNGEPVMKAVYSFPNMISACTSPSQGSMASIRGVEEAKPCLMLLTLAEDETVFASCTQSPVGSLVIQDSKSRAFGSIRPQSQQMNIGMIWEIMTGKGNMHYVSSLIAEELNITDREGRLVAMTEAVSGRPDTRAVRIGPFADAGLVVLALLAIDILKGASIGTLAAV